jgi:tetratricopeptide (TPR) repeat protein
VLSIYGGVPPTQCFPRAKAAVLKALELDETLGEAHATLAQILFRYEWDRLGAEKEFRRSLELNPNYAWGYSLYALHLADLGRMSEAIVAARRGQELDPLSLNVSAHLGLIRRLARQYDHAIDEDRKTIELQPLYPRGHIGLGEDYIYKGRYKDSLAELQAAATLDGGVAYTTAVLGYVYAISGRRAEAQKTLDALKERAARLYVPPHSIALIYTALGDKDQAFAWLEKAFEARDDGTGYSLRYPLWDSLRSDSRFTEFLQRWRLPP